MEKLQILHLNVAQVETFLMSESAVCINRGLRRMGANSFCHETDRRRTERKFASIQVGEKRILNNHDIVMFSVVEHLEFQPCVRSYCLCDLHGQLGEMQSRDM